MSIAVLSQAKGQTLAYSIGSATENLLDFRPNPPTGTVGTVNANTPGLAVALAYNNVEGSGSGSGWTLTARGGAAIGAVVVLGSSRAQTSTVGNVLNFNMISTGLSDLVGLNLAARWSGSTSIAAANLTASNQNFYTYEFDVAVNNSVLSLSPSVFSGINLTIRDGGNNMVYNQSNLASILGLANLTSSTVTDARVNFTYNPATGPLSITWSGQSTADVSLLTNLGGAGTRSLFAVSNGDILRYDVVPVPEPSTAVLVMLAGILVILRRSRLRVDLTEQSSDFFLIEVVSAGRFRRWLNLSKSL